MNELSSTPSPARASSDGPTGLCLPAAASFFLSVLSIGACLLAAGLAVVSTPRAAVVILGLPLVGAAAVALGFVGIRRIDRSGGRLAGRPLAIAGLFLGIISALLQGAAGIGALGSAWAVKRSLAPVVESFMLGFQRGDTTTARSCLGAATAGELTDESLASFFARATEPMGQFQSADFGLDAMFRASRFIREAAASLPPGQSVTENPKPLELVFERGRTLAFVIPDDDAARKDKRVAINDVLVVFEGRPALTLREAGPAASLAKRLGLEVQSGPKPGG